MATQSNPLMDALAKSKGQVLSDKWQQRLLQTDDVGRHILMASRSDLNEASIAFLKKQSSVKVRFPLIDGQVDNLALMNEFALTEKRQSVLLRLADIQGLSTEAVQHMAKTASSAELATKLAGRADVDTETRQGLYRVVLEHQARNPNAASLKNLQACVEHGNATQLLLASTNARQVFRLLGWSDRRLTIEEARHAISFIDERQLQLGVEIDTARMPLGLFLDIVESLLMVPGLTGEHLSTIRTALSDLQGVFRKQFVQGHPRSWTVQRALDRLDAEKKFLSDRNFLSLYRGACADTAAELAVVVREINALPSSDAGMSLRKRMTQLVLLNPAATLEVAVAVLGGLYDSEESDCYEVAAHFYPLQFELAVAIVTAGHGCRSLYQLMNLVLASQEPSRVLEHSLLSTEWGPRVDVCVLSSSLSKRGGDASCLEVLASAARNSFLGWDIMDNESLLGSLSEQLMDILGDCEDAWYTFQQMSADSDQTILELAAMAAKIANHSPA